MIRFLNTKAVVFGLLLLVAAISCTPVSPKPERPSPSDHIMNVSGRWEYMCTRSGKRIFPHGGYEHGGTISLSQSQVGSGISLSLVGERQWIKKELPSGIDKTFRESTRWESKEGAFTGDSSIMFYYQTYGTEILGGFVRATITEYKDNTPYIMKGTFAFQLPDELAMTGNITMRRMEGATDFQFNTEVPRSVPEKPN